MILYESEYHLYCKCKRDGELFIQVHSDGSHTVKDVKEKDFGSCDICDTKFKIWKIVPYKIDESKPKKTKLKDVIINGVI